MKTKALVRFLNRAARFEGDVELVDVLALAVKAGALTPASGKHVFTHLQPAKHPRLVKQTASPHNREILINHLKTTIHAAYIKDIYEDMSFYFSEVLKAAAHNGLDPARLIGNHRFDIAANELLACGSWDNVVELISQRLFRKLEDEKSTMKLLEKIDSKLGLKVNKQVIIDALPYLEIRHLLVHRDGVPDAAFVKQHPKIGLVAGDRMDLTHKLVEDTRKRVQALVTHYDSRIVAEKIVSKDDLQP